MLGKMLVPDLNPKETGVRTTAVRSWEGTFDHTVPNAPHQE
jgi:hypothetical protein